MPPRIDPRDWDRLFRQGTPRRGGPLRALVNLLVIGVVLGLLSLGTTFALGRIDQAREQTLAEVQTETANTLRIYTTRTAEAEIATAEATAQAASAATPTTAPPPLIGRGSVLNGGNLRSQPIVQPETVIGQICPGDSVDFLEQSTTADGSLWYRIRLTATGPDCSPQRVTLGSSGWASSTLLSQPAP